MTEIPAEPHPLADVPDDQLWTDLAEVCARINAHDDDLARRLDLYEALRERGVFVKDIAEVAGVTPNAVTWALTKAERERAGTWTRKRRVKRKR
jgi:hypothetical protein